MLKRDQQSSARRKFTQELPGNERRTFVHIISDEIQLNWIIPCCITFNKVRTFYKRKTFIHMQYLVNTLDIYTLILLPETYMHQYLS